MHTTQQKKSKKMDRKNDQRKFEFTLYLNDNIIVQRYFNIIGFNKRAINSINFKEAVDDNMELIKDVLKERAVDFINKYQYRFYDTPGYEQNDSEDKLKIVVKREGKVIAYREWDATVYPVKIRYTVDVREHIYELITRIQKCLCTQDKYLETEYMGYNLEMDLEQ